MGGNPQGLRMNKPACIQYPGCHATFMLLRHCHKYYTLESLLQYENTMIVITYDVEGVIKRRFFD